MLPPYKTEFIELCMKLGVLKFGSFKLKSGRPGSEQACIQHRGAPDFSLKLPNFKTPSFMHSSMNSVL